jgi:hypothetical protein
VKPSEKCSINSLPFRNNTVRGAPDGIFPVMSDFCGFADNFFVDFNAESGSIIAVNTAVAVFKD